MLLTFSFLLIGLKFQLAVATGNPQSGLTARDLKRDLEWRSEVLDDSSSHSGLQWHKIGLTASNLCRDLKWDSEWRSEVLDCSSSHSGLQCQK